LITLTISGEEYKLRSSALCDFFPPPITSSIVSTPQSLNVKDKVSHPQKTSKIIVFITRLREKN
jgi:hypothetical protein